MVKKITSLVIVLTMLCSFVSCSCEHEWEHPTCAKPKTCVLCGATEGDTLEHHWLDATCQQPKTCKNCGETVGDTIDHIWMDATCYSPKTCNMCGEEKGSVLPHNYGKNGRCVECQAKDPDYVDLEKYGFEDNRGMTTWISIQGYDFGEGYVISFYQYDLMFTSDILYVGEYENNSFSVSDNTIGVASCEIVSNNKLRFEYGGSWGTLLIYDRVVSKDGMKIVLKTRRSNEEEWYIPADMIDWSRGSFSDEKGRKCYYLK